jgi:NAD(P)-dependent dehydrogenase (short-subunit alcohol dehydrogenase family)
VISTSPVAVVTGAAQGIGRRTAEALAREGYALALADLHEPDGTLAALAELGAEDAIALTGDVSVQEQVDALVHRVTARFGRIDPRSW